MFVPYFIYSSFILFSKGNVFLVFKIGGFKDYINHNKSQSTKNRDDRYIDDR